MLWIGSGGGRYADLWETAGDESREDHAGQLTIGFQ